MSRSASARWAIEEDLKDLVIPEDEPGYWATPEPNICHATVTRESSPARGADRLVARCPETGEIIAIQVLQPGMSVHGWTPMHAHAEPKDCSHERRYVGNDQDWEPFVYCADCRVDLPINPSEPKD